MLSIDSLIQGLVIDHIPVGRAMDIYNYLNLGSLDCTVAIIKNTRSDKMGRKDIIKIEDLVDIDLAVLGIFDSRLTVNVIKGGVIVDKILPDAPAVVHAVLRCKNPRCVTTAEQGLEQVFVLSDCDQRQYRCLYCEQEF